MKLVYNIILNKDIDTYGDDEIDLYELGLLRPSKHIGWKNKLKNKEKHLKLVVSNGENKNGT